MLNRPSRYYQNSSNTENFTPPSSACNDSGRYSQISNTQTESLEEIVADDLNYQTGTAQDFERNDENIISTTGLISTRSDASVFVETVSTMSPSDTKGNCRMGSERKKQLPISILDALIYKVKLFPKILSTSSPLFLLDSCR